jgi:hypothetical protein
MSINKNKMAKVIEFPKQEPHPKVIKGYRMAFYTQDEIDLAVLCLNTYGWKRIGHTRDTLAQVDPLYIKECLIRGYNSELFSYPARKLINKIIDGMEEIAVPVNH